MHNGFTKQSAFSGIAFYGTMRKTGLYFVQYDVSRFCSEQGCICRILIRCRKWNGCKAAYRSMSLSDFRYSATSGRIGPKSGLSTYGQNVPKSPRMVFVLFGSFALRLLTLRRLAHDVLNYRHKPFRGAFHSHHEFVKP